ncbi:hypothetical protein LPTSP4_22090 [Leptospira ryugenii]|uniref:Outer membrane protein n=1 Tax=Leptospira ryugenii TaxID=1917863 RepID=A0A2P2E1D2_9LEPT|nr:hypothetical protein [Leptospira ryugenii]GBF50682.1 hypothetical protein LPTSP4_22090 [Leptospira ryugenii]
MALLKKLIPISFVFFSLPILSQTVWAPYQRQLWVRPIFTHSEYNSAYLAKSFAKYDDNVRITAGSLALEYGITDRLTVDFFSGFGKLGRHRIFDRYAGLQQTPEVPDRYGVLDSRLGLRYKIVDEYDSKYRWMPTLSVRVGAIKKGDYDRNPQSLGDGASGGEVTLYYAKDFDIWGLGILGDVAYRKRESPVPDDILYYSAIYKRFLESFFLTIGGRGQIGQGGYAYADPRQAPPYNYYNLTTQDLIPGLNLTDLWIRDQRPAWGRKETFHNLEIGLGYSDSFGNFYNLFYSETYAGYNTAKLKTIGFAVNLPFNI